MGKPAARPKPKTLSRREMVREKRRRERAGDVLKVVDYQRPLTRADCAKGARPCLYVACKHHLYLDVNPETGSIKLNFPDAEVWELEETCALDVAERGGVTLEEVGEILNLTRERVRQVEVSGLRKLRGTSCQRELERFVGLDFSNLGADELEDEPGHGYGGGFASGDGHLSSDDDDDSESGDDDL